MQVDKQVANWEIQEKRDPLWAEVPLPMEQATLNNYPHIIDDISFLVLLFARSSLSSTVVWAPRMRIWLDRTGLQHLTTYRPVI